MTHSKHLQKSFISSRLIHALSVGAMMLSGWSASLTLPDKVQSLSDINLSETGRSPNLIRISSRVIPDFSGTGRSGNRVGGASRSGGCGASSHPMMPLVPLGADYGGRTIHAQPTVWVYVPYVLDEESPVTFAINDEDGDEVYQTTFTARFDSGVYGIQLPASVELEIDTYYDWYVLVYCNDPLRQEVPSFAGGWIQRVESPLDLSTEGIDTMSPVEQSQFFAEQLLWYDALTPLGEALQANSGNTMITAAWNELLTLPSVQLDDLTPFPVTPCCEMPDSEQ